MASDVSISMRTVWSLTLLSPEQPHRTPLHTPAYYFPEGDLELLELGPHGFHLHPGMKWLLSI